MLGNQIEVKKQDDLFITEPLKDRSICFFVFTVLSRVNVYVYANVGYFFSLLSCETCVMRGLKTWRSEL